MNFDDDDVDIGDMLPEEQKKEFRGNVVQMLQNVVMPLSVAAMNAAFLGREDLQEQLTLMASEIAEVLEEMESAGYVIEAEGDPDDGDFAAGLMQP